MVHIQKNDLLHGAAFLPVEAPPLRFHEKSPVLAEDSRAKLQDLWQAFWRLRAVNLLDGANCTTEIHTGDLFHTLRDFSLDTVRQILSSGIVAGEIGFPGKEPVPEDCETHFCADFWVKTAASGESTSLDDYFRWARTAKEGSFPVSERNWVPSDRNNSISFVIRPTLPGLRGSVT